MSQITSRVTAASLGSVLTVTGDSGGAISPDGAGDIGLVGGTTGLTFAGAANAQTLGGTLIVANGGSGRASATAYGVICGGTTSTAAHQSIASVGTSAQVLTSNGAGALPTFQDAAGGGLSWSVVTGTTQAMVAQEGYIANNAGLVTATLPATSAVGDTFAITGMNNATGWKIAQNASQTIHFGSSDTTTGVGGSLASSATYDSVELICNVANTSFIVVSSIGNITVV